MKKILGETKTVREPVGNARYDVDYYFLGSVVISRNGSREI